MRTISILILKLLGWKITSNFPKDIKKCVLIFAHHTSNIDFVIGRLTFFSFGINPKFFIKKELFFFPLGLILKMLGGIPIDRQKKNKVVTNISETFNNSDDFKLLITPEGTRKYVKTWKRGFYHIAIDAKVPIVLTFIDYPTKTGGVGPIIHPSGNYEADFAIIRDFYKEYSGKVTEFTNHNPSC